MEILQSISLAQFNSEQRVNLLPSKYQPGCLNRLSQSCLLALLRESILTKANTIACASLPPRRPEIGHPTQEIVLFEICLNKKTISSIYIPHFFRKSEKKGKHYVSVLYQTKNWIFLVFRVIEIEDYRKPY